MADFTDDLRNEDPALLRRLRTMLRGAGAAPRPLPTIAERFGVAVSGPATPADGTAIHREPVLVGHSAPWRSGRD